MLPLSSLLTPATAEAATYTTTLVIRVISDYINKKKYINVRHTLVPLSSYAQIALHIQVSVFVYIYNVLISMLMFSYCV